MGEHSILTLLTSIEATATRRGLILPPSDGLDDLVFRLEDEPALLRDQAPLRPLDDELLAMHDQLIGGVRSCGEILERSIPYDWGQGRCYYLSLTTRLWLYHPRYRDLKYIDYMQKVTGYKSTSPIYRRIIIGRFYSLEEYQAYLDRGAHMTTLAEMYRADPRLWPHLRQVIWTHGGLSGEELADAREGGEALLKKLDAAEATPEQLVAEMDLRVAQQRKRAVDDGAKRAKKGERRGHGSRAGEGDESSAVQALNQMVQQAQHNAAQAEREVVELRGENEALREQVQQIDQRLRQEQDQQQRQGSLTAQVQAQKAELDQRLGQVQAQQAELSQRLAAMRTQESKLDQHAADIRQQEDQLLQRLSALQAQEAELAQRLSALQAQESMLSQGLSTLQAQETALSQREALLKEAAGGSLSEATEARFQQAQALLAQAEQERHALLARQQHVQESHALAESRLQEAQAQLAEGQRLLAQAHQQEARAAAALSAAADLEQRAAALTAREAELSALADDLARSAADQDQTTLRHAEEHAELSSLRASLGETQKTLLAETGRLTQERARFARDQYEFTLWIYQQVPTGWPDEPYSIDAALMAIDAHLVRVAELVNRAVDFLSQGALPLRGGLAQVAKAARSFGNLAKGLPQFVDDIVHAFATREPQAAAAYAAQLDQMPKGQTPALPPGQPPDTTRVEAVKHFDKKTTALLGCKQDDSPQQGVLGLTQDGKYLVTINMNNPQAIVILGQQDSGKSSTVAAICENALSAKKNICDTQAPMAIIATHYSDDPKGKTPNWGNLFKPNTEKPGVEVLRDKYGAGPAGYEVRRKVVYVMPQDEASLEWMRKQYAGMEVRVIGFAPSAFTKDFLMMLMGTAKQSPLYIQRIAEAVAPLKNPTAEEFLAAVAALSFPPNIKLLVDARLALIKRLLAGDPIGHDLQPGDFVGVDLRAAYLDGKQAMTIFTMAANEFSRAGIKVVRDGQEVEERFMKIMVFDEAHKYMKRGMISEKIIAMIREMRHESLWVIIASQDPESLDPLVLSLATITIVHRLVSAASLKWLAENSIGWQGFDARLLMGLRSGEAYVLAVECVNELYRSIPQRTNIRPTCCLPSGTTKTAVPTP